MPANTSLKGRSDGDGDARSEYYHIVLELVEAKENNPGTYSEDLRVFQRHSANKLRPDH